MADIEKRQADRLRVMKAIYDASGGSELTAVSGPIFWKRQDCLTKS